MNSESRNLRSCVVSPIQHWRQEPGRRVEVIGIGGLATAPDPFSVQPPVSLLKLDATLVNVGQLGTVRGLSGIMMGFGRHSLGTEPQEMLDFCAEKGIVADIRSRAPQLEPEHLPFDSGDGVRVRRNGL